MDDINEVESGDSENNNARENGSAPDEETFPGPKGRPAGKMLLIGIPVVLILLLGGFFGYRAYHAMQVEKQIAVADQYMADGDFAGAVELYQGIVQAEPDSIPARSGLAAAYLESNLAVSANETLDGLEQMGIDGMSREDLLKQCDHMMALGRIDLAIWLLDKSGRYQSDPEILTRLEQLQNDPGVKIEATYTDLLYNDPIVMKMLYLSPDGKAHIINANWSQDPAAGAMNTLTSGEARFISGQTDATCTISACFGSLKRELKVSISKELVQAESDALLSQIATDARSYFGQEAQSWVYSLQDNYILGAAFPWDIFGMPYMASYQHTGPGQWQAGPPAKFSAN